MKNERSLSELCAGFCMPFFFCFLFAGTTLYSSANGLDSTSTPADSVKNTFLGLPFVFFTPETGFGGGLGGIYAFRFKKEREIVPSEVRFGFAYTSRKQVLVYFPFRLFFDDRNYTAYGEVGFYRFNFRFYGIGNDGNITDFETYESEFPRVNLHFLKRVYPKMYAGLRYSFENYIITETEEGEPLSEGEIVGSRGGVTSGLGFVMNYDSRDNIYFPERGSFLEVVALPFREGLGSDFDFTRISVDYSVFFLSSWKHIFAFNLFGDFVSGVVPFNQLAMLGGTKKMRGYFRGQLQDNNLLLFQTEYRAPIYKKWAAVGFCNFGSVAGEINDFWAPNTRITGGVGARYAINEEDKINIRADVAFGKDAFGFYLTVGEAF